MQRRRLTAACIVAVTLAGCGGGDTGDPQRARLLGGLPPDQADRGVYVVDLTTAGELSPGSRVGPFLGAVLDEADLLVETTAPPVTLLGGVAPDIATPAHALRVGTTLVFAEPEVAETVAQRLRDEQAPVPGLTAAAATSAPVVWLGPTPATRAAGSTLVELAPDTVTFTVTPASPSDTAVEETRGALSAGTPPGSPGKSWDVLLADADVHADGERVVITATPRDLPGPLLRSLLDQRQLTFLPG